MENIQRNYVTIIAGMNPKTRFGDCKITPLSYACGMIQLATITALRLQYPGFRLSKDYSALQHP
jgi:hypothetical protein